MILPKKLLIVSLPLLAVLAAIALWFLIDALRPWARNPASERKERSWEGRPCRVIDGEFEVKVGLPLNRVTRVRYLIPVDEAGEPLPQARRNLIFYAPFNGEDGSTFPERLGWLDFFPAETGAAIFSLRIVCDGSSASSDDYYIYRDSGWHEVIMKAREHIAREYGLELNPMFAIGESAGSSLAERLVAAYPGAFAAAGWCGGNNYADPPPEAAGTAILALNTWGCPGTGNTRELVEKMRALGYPVWWSETPPGGSPPNFDHHAAGPDAYRLIQEFIAAAIARSQAPAGPGGGDFPSEAFNARWNALPRDVTVYLGGRADRDTPLPVWPAWENTERLVVAVNDASVVSRPDFLDMLSLLSQRHCRILVADSEDPRAASALQLLLDDGDFRELPVYVIGTGFGGNLIAPAALRNGDPRIVQAAIWQSSYQHPFSELSPADARGAGDTPLLVGLGKTEEPPAEEIPHTRFARFGTLWNFFRDAAEVK